MNQSNTLYRLMKLFLSPKKRKKKLKLFMTFDRKWTNATDAATAGH